MKVIASTGLVPVKGLVRTQFKAGTVFGLTPERAMKGVLAGEVELHPIPDGIETFDVAGPEAEAKEEPDTVDSDGVDIPENWDLPPSQGGLQWMQRVKLAEQILGHRIDVEKGAKPKPVDVADEVIRNELERRAAAEQPPQD